MASHVFNYYIIKVALLLITVLIFPCTALATLTFINEIPDFTQTRLRDINTNNGDHFCGPVAVSNSLVWLSKYRVAQLPLIYRLASSNYMNTDIGRGTNVTMLLTGVDRLTTELFGGYKTLEYEGWRSHPVKFSNGNKVPSIERISHAISSNSAAWINVGWYKYNSKTDEYLRIGGHWVTLVGYVNGQLILHDPAPRAGQTFSNEFVTFSVIHRGTLVGTSNQLPVNAKGFISLDAGMHKNEDADYAIIDGIVYLQL